MAHAVHSFVSFGARLRDFHAVEPVQVIGIRLAVGDAIYYNFRKICVSYNPENKLQFREIKRDAKQNG